MQKAVPLYFASLDFHASAIQSNTALWISLVESSLRYQRVSSIYGTISSIIRVAFYVGLANIKQLEYRACVYISLVTDPYKGLHCICLNSYIHKYIQKALSIPFQCTW